MSCHIIQSFMKQVEQSVIKVRIYQEIEALEASHFVLNDVTLSYNTHM